MPEPSKKLAKFDIVILLLSFYTLIELYLALIFKYTETEKIITSCLDLGICGVFIYDFTIRLKKSENKINFIKSNWIDLISSIPMIGILRIGRAARIMRLLRLMRSGKVFYSVLDRHKATSTFKVVLWLDAIVVILGALAMFHIEAAENSFFSSFGNSIWWSAVTATTMGFAQDTIPVTPEGKIVSMFLIGAGIALVGTFSGMVADYFIGDEVILCKLDNIELRIKEISEKLDSITKN